MSKKILIPSIAVIILGIVLIGLSVIKNRQATKTQAAAEQSADAQTEDIAVADSAIQVTLGWSKTKNNTLVLSLAGMGSKYTSAAYEITYETKGTVQGLIDKPMDITGKDTFVKDDIYLGTCSKNVCTPHTGVTKVSLVLKFTATDGKQSQFSKDFDL